MSRQKLFDASRWQSRRRTKKEPKRRKKPSREHHGNITEICKRDVLAGPSTANHKNAHSSLSSPWRHTNRQFIPTTHYLFDKTTYRLVKWTFVCSVAGNCAAMLQNNSPDLQRSDLRHGAATARRIVPCPPLLRAWAAVGRSEIENHSLLKGIAVHTFFFSISRCWL